jgi:ABC-type phosphate/phosphonate transport system substrate-binding protein
MVAAPVPTMDWQEPTASGERHDDDEHVYYSPVFVGADVDVDVDSLKAASLHSGLRFGFNDKRSHSGLFSVVHALLEHDSAHSDVSKCFIEWVATGGHVQSLRLLAKGRIDVAALDSQLVGKIRRGHSCRPQIEQLKRLRHIGTLGPFLVQPCVVSVTLDADLRELVIDTLMSLDKCQLADYGYRRFVALDDSMRADYMSAFGGARAYAKRFNVLLDRVLAKCTVLSNLQCVSSSSCSSSSSSSSSSPSSSSSSPP